MTRFNLFISYDLVDPGQNYHELIERIKGLGSYYHAQQSLWYVNTEFAPEFVHQHLMQVMDRNDKLMVVNATNAIMYPAPPDHVEAINRVWFEMA
jgi:hypothetical protein